MPNIFQSSFWDDMNGGMWDELSDLMLEVYLSGIDGGVNSMPPNLRVFTDWNRVNVKAMEWAKNYKYSWIKNINETTRLQTQKAVSDWIQSGAPLKALDRVLEPIFGEVRAKMIAQTETTRVYAEANRDAWEATDLVEEVKWQTAEDELVCPICGALDGTMINMEDASQFPPAHVNCRCYILPVVSDEALERKLAEVVPE